MAVEREVKVALSSEADYHRIASLLPQFEGEIVQRNSYWDLPDGKLARGGTMLRLRIETGGRAERAFVTSKEGAAQRSPGVFEIPEEEDAISASDARAVLAGERTLASTGIPLLAALARRYGDLSRLRLWGEMTNTRRRYRLPNGLVIELDCTSFPGGNVEWEIELESDDTVAAERELASILANAGVKGTPQTRPKSDRLRKYLGI